MIGDRRVIWFVFAIAVVLANAASGGSHAAITSFGQY
jgi:hypothetical protein